MIITAKQYRSNATGGIGSLFRIKGKIDKILMINERITALFFLIKSPSQKNNVVIMNRIMDVQINTFNKSGD